MRAASTSIAEVQVRMADAARRAGHIGAAHAICIEQQEIGLERLEAAVAGLAPHRFQIVEATHRRRIDEIAAEERGMQRARHAAARPIDGQAPANRAAEKFIDGNAQRLRLDLDAGIDDRPDRMGLQAAGRAARHRLQEGIDLVDRARILADDETAEAEDQTGEPAPPAPLAELRPADEARIGGDLEERVIVPAGIDIEVFELDDFHRFPRSLYLLPRAEKV